jgi:Ribonuclease G/E
VKSNETVAAEIVRAIQAKAAAETTPSEGREIVTRAHPELVSVLNGEGRPDLDRLEELLDVKIIVQADSAQTPREEYELKLR